MRVFFQRVLIALVILTVLAVAPAFAQDNAPTSAPSATPFPANDATRTPISPTLAATFDLIATPMPPREAAPFDPLTQSDLSVLTGNVQRPNAIAYLDGMLYIACTGDSTIYATDSVTGQTRTYIWGVLNAHTLVAEADSNDVLSLWIPDYDSNSLVRVTRGAVTRIARDLSGPWGIVDLGDESFLISNVRGNSITQVARDGTANVVIDGLSSPTGIAHDGEHLYIANNGSARRAIEWIALDDVGRTTQTQPLLRGIQSPTGVQLGADGYLYVAYSLGTRGVVGRIDPEECRANGGCQNDQIEIVLYTEIAAPLAGLTISPDMRLFVHTMFSPDIYWAQL
jgi:hypothetical protein